MKGQIQLLTRLYNTLIGLGMTFYTLGIGLVTPHADYKWVYLTAIIVILLSIVIFVNVRRTEKFDGRAVQNMLKTSAVTSVIIAAMIIVLFMVLLISNTHIYISAGLLAIVIGVIFTSFAYTFFIFERQGK